MNLTAAARELLNQALELPAQERGLVFEELFDSLAGHDELNALMDELERRGDLIWEPDLAEIERRVREAHDPAESRTWSSASEMIERLRRELADRPRDRTPSPRTLRVDGRAGDVAGAALRLSAPERAALAHGILETIERCDEDG